MYFLLDLLDLVDEVDLSAILIPAQAKDPRGEKTFDPRMMTLLLLYAYCVGTVSSHKIERACYEDLAFRVLTGISSPITAASVSSAAATLMRSRVYLFRSCGCVRSRGW